jgi:hypothetical protein
VMLATMPSSLVAEFPEDMTQEGNV